MRLCVLDGLLGLPYSLSCLWCRYGLGWLFFYGEGLCVLVCWLGSLIYPGMYLLCGVFLFPGCLASCGGGLWVFLFWFGFLNCPGVCFWGSCVSPRGCFFLGSCSLMGCFFSSSGGFWVVFLSLGLVVCLGSHFLMGWFFSNSGGFLVVFLSLGLVVFLGIFGSWALGRICRFCILVGFLGGVWGFDLSFVFRFVRLFGRLFWWVFWLVLFRRVVWCVEWSWLVKEYTSVSESAVACGVVSAYLVSFFLGCWVGSGALDDGFHELYGLSYTFDVALDDEWGFFTALYSVYLRFCCLFYANDGCTFSPYYSCCCLFVGCYYFSGDFGGFLSASWWSWWGWGFIVCVLYSDSERFVFILYFPVLVWGISARAKFAAANMSIHPSVPHVVSTLYLRQYSLNPLYICTFLALFLNL